MNPKRGSHSAAVLFFKKDVDKKGGSEGGIDRKKERAREGWVQLGRFPPSQQGSV